MVRLAIEEYRNFAFAEVEVAPEGITLVKGINGQGKTNLLEAVSLLTVQESFRGAEYSAMIRDGAASTRVRGTLAGEAYSDEAERELTLQVELLRDSKAGKARFSRNGNVLKRNRDLLGELVSVSFYPDDLELIKGGPAARRRFLDDAATSGSARNTQTRSTFERTLRQRSRLLKQAGGRLDPDIVSTLDVWDSKLAEAGETLVELRETLVEALEGPVREQYRQLSGTEAEVSVVYQRSWSGPLLEALEQTRSQDVRSGTMHLGPQRDDLVVSLAGVPARSYGSQGEQRCLALGLRMAVHDVIRAQTGNPPILLLDDVFSELDSHRSAALIGALPPGQILISAASGVPESLSPAHVIEVVAGTVTAP